MGVLRRWRRQAGARRHVAVEPVDRDAIRQSEVVRLKERWFRFIQLKMRKASAARAAVNGAMLVS